MESVISIFIYLCSICLSILTVSVLFISPSRFNLDIQPVLTFFSITVVKEVTCKDKDIHCSNFFGAMYRFGQSLLLAVLVTQVSHWLDVPNFPFLSLCNLLFCNFAFYFFIVCDVNVFE